MAIFCHQSMNQYLINGESHGTRTSNWSVFRFHVCVNCLLSLSRQLYLQHSKIYRYSHLAPKPIDSWIYTLLRSWFGDCFEAIWKHFGHIATWRQVITSESTVARTRPGPKTSCITSQVLEHCTFTGQVTNISTLCTCRSSKLLKRVGITFKETYTCTCKCFHSFCLLSLYMQIMQMWYFQSRSTN